MLIGYALEIVESKTYNRVVKHVCNTMLTFSLGVSIVGSTSWKDGNIENDLIVLCT